MNLQQIAALLLGVWGASLSSYLAYRGIRGDQEMARLAIAYWTEGDALDAEDATAGVQICVSNVGRTPLTVTAIEFTRVDGQAFYPPLHVAATEQRRGQPLPTRVDAGDEASFLMRFDQVMWATQMVEARSARGGRFAASLNADAKGEGWVMVEAHLNMQTVAKVIGLKPGSTPRPDPIEWLREHEGMDTALVHRILWSLARQKARERFSGPAEPGDDLFVPAPLSREASDALLAGMKMLIRTTPDTTLGIDGLNAIARKPPDAGRADAKSTRASQP